MTLSVIPAFTVTLPAVTFDWLAWLESIVALTPFRTVVSISVAPIAVSPDTPTAPARLRMEIGSVAATFTAPALVTELPAPTVACEPTFRMTPPRIPAMALLSAAAALASNRSTVCALFARTLSEPEWVRLAFGSRLPVT